MSAKDILNHMIIGDCWIGEDLDNPVAEGTCIKSENNETLGFYQINDTDNYKIVKTSGTNYKELVLTEDDMLTLIAFIIESKE
jgi:hypothetical protein